MKKLTLLFILISISTFINAQWIQVGNTIIGEYNDRNGISVSMSADGSIIACGAYGNDGLSTAEGCVRIFQNIGNTWEQIGSDIYGESAFDVSGGNVCISDDGNIVAIGSTQHDSHKGQVRVFQNIAGNWEQVGASINGSNPDDLFSKGLSLSADGNVFAAGAWSAYTHTGEVKIFENTSGTWIQKGQSLLGDSVGDCLGYSLCLSDDGNTLAIGANGAYTNGCVKVYEYNSGTWVQVGTTIIGESENENFGKSVSLSANGNILIAGAYYNSDMDTTSGCARVYQNIGGIWTKIGDNIYGEAQNDMFGVFVDISSDGNIIAISSHLNDDAGNNAGHVRIFENVSGNWVQIGDNINGEVADDLSGTSFSLSNDGSIIGIGSPYNSEEIYHAGHVRIFTNKPTNNSNLNNTSFTIFPNPSNGFISVEAKEMKQIEIINISGNIIKSINIDNSDIQNIDINNQGKGIYFVKVITTNGSISKKIIIE